MGHHLAVVELEDNWGREVQEVPSDLGCSPQSQEVLLERLVERELAVDRAPSRAPADLAEGFLLGMPLRPEEQEVSPLCDATRPSRRAAAPVRRAVLLSSPPERPTNLEQLAAVVAEELILVVALGGMVYVDRVAEAVVLPQTDSETLVAEETVATVRCGSPAGRFLITIFLGGRRLGSISWHLCL